MAAASTSAADEVEDGEASEEDCVDCLAYAWFNSIYDSANSRLERAGLILMRLINSGGKVGRAATSGGYRYSGRVR